MKLLGLHGYLQNGRKFRGQTNALRRHLKRVGVEVIFIDAPFVIPNTNDLRSWCKEKPKTEEPDKKETNGDDDMKHDHDCTESIKEEDLKDISESYKCIIKAHEENPDIVGILGFSMGSLFALHLAALASVNKDSPFSWIKIIIAAATPYNEKEEENPFASCFPCKCDVPVLFVVGATDEIAPAAQQKRYVEYFPNCKVFEHEGGHFIPSSKDKVQPFIDFIESNKDIVTE